MLCAVQIPFHPADAELDQARFMLLRAPDDSLEK